MPRGTNDTIPSGTGKTYRTTTGDIRQTLLVLNPNNGILYVAINTQASPAVWDFVVPSQSRAYLPGPWLGYGLYYVDQSGAGGSGNVTIYESDVSIQVPDYAAVGIARLAEVTSLDVTEGNQPANPGVGILRLWSDVTGLLQALQSNGANDQFVYRTLAQALTNKTFDGSSNIPVSLGYTRLAAAAALIDFSNIPQTFEHLLFFQQCRSDIVAGTVQPRLRFNGDALGHYYSQRIIGTGAAAPASSEDLADTSLPAGLIVGTQAVPIATAVNLGLIIGYSQTAYEHPMVGISFAYTGVTTGSLSVALFGGFWDSAVAVNELTFYPNATNFIAGSAVSLYGI